MTWADELMVIWLHRWIERKRWRGVRRRTDNREGIRQNGSRWGFVKP